MRCAECSHASLSAFGLTERDYDYKWCTIISILQDNDNDIYNIIETVQGIQNRTA